MITARLAALVLLVLLGGCGDDDYDRAAPTPTATSRPANLEDFTGIYDLAADGPLGEFDDLVAAVTAGGDDVGLFFDASPRLSLNASGPWLRDGTIELVGTAFVGRRGFTIRGRATGSIDGGTRRIVGSLRAENSFIEFATTFVAERPARSDSAAFTGRHRFAFTPSPSGCACDSTAELELHAQANGFGSSEVAAEDRDADGTVRGTFGPGSHCLISPSGRVACILHYERPVPSPPPPPEPDAPLLFAFLYGRLARRGDVTPGTGRLEVDRRRPERLSEGVWIATPIAPDD